MKVFISWSGRRSRAVAEGLRGWLPDVIQAVDPFISSDINAGARWFSEVGDQLSDTNFGIICLTRENQQRQWLMFEAGALAKVTQDSFVVPYLIDMEPGEIEGPLEQFQAKRTSKEETLELVSSINSAMEGGNLDSAQLQRLFDVFWPSLQETLENLPEPEGSGDRERNTVNQEVGRPVGRDTIRAFNNARELGTSINNWLHVREMEDPIHNADSEIWMRSQGDPQQQEILREYDRYIDEVLGEYRRDFLQRVVEVRGELIEHGVVMNPGFEENYANPRNYKGIRSVFEGLWDMAGRLERGSSI